MRVLSPLGRLAAAAALLTWTLGHAAETARGLPDFTDLAVENTPSVVNVSTTQARSEQTGLPPGMEMPEIPQDNPLGDLLRRFFGGGGDDPPLRSQSLGSGLILSADGYVITNGHVVEDAEEIVVKLSDRRELEAQVVGVDTYSNIALLKVEADGLPVPQLGSAEDLRAGEWVLAIGSPFGFEHSVTAGIVSAKGRNLPSENYVPFIQTDVAVNPGSSGGPLFNLDGQVIGINAQIDSRSGGFTGLSFAIPIEVAMRVVEQLKTTGHVSRGWLGVYIQEVTRELAESFDMRKPVGALIAKILPDSPSAHANLQVGDIITRYDGREVASSATLPSMVGRTPVGKEVELEIVRQGERLTSTLTIGELPASEAALQARVEGSRNSRVLGLKLEPLSPAQRKEMDLEQGGLRVVEVGPGAGKDAGIRAGDVIQRVNNRTVSSVQQLRELVAGLPGDKFASILVQRAQGQGPEFLALEVPE